MNRILDRYSMLRTLYAWALPKNTGLGFRIPMNVTLKDIHVSQADERSTQADDMDLPLSEQRKLYTGNYFAGPAAMINPAFSTK